VEPHLRCLILHNGVVHSEAQGQFHFTIPFGAAYLIRSLCEVHINTFRQVDRMGHFTSAFISVQTPGVEMVTHLYIWEHQNKFWFLGLKPSLKEIKT